MVQLLEKHQLATLLNMLTKQMPPDSGIVDACLSYTSYDAVDPLRLGLRLSPLNESTKRNRLKLTPAASVRMAPQEGFW